MSAKNKRKNNTDQHLSAKEPKEGMTKSLTLKVVRKRMVLVIFAVSFLFYGNTMWNGYSMDDELVVKGHPLVAKGFSGIPKIFTSRYSVNEKQNYEYRPLVLTTFAIEYQFFGQNPALSHLLNILFYALTGVVLFMLLLQMFKNYHWILPAITTLTFLIHPVHTEVVASLKNRDEILSMLFVLLSMRSFLIYNEREEVKHIVYGMSFMGLSLLAKVSSMPMIVLIPFTVWYFGKPTRSKLVLTLIGLLASYKMMRVMSNILTSAEAQKRDLLYMENPLYSGDCGFLERIPVAVETVGFYLQKFIIPYPLISYYGYNTFPISGWGDLSFLFNLALLAGLLYLAIAGFKDRSPVTYGIIFFFVSVSMFANLVVPAVGIVAERFAFGPSLGLSLVFGTLLLKLLRFDLHSGKMEVKFSRPVLLGGAMLVLVSGILVITRNKDWYSAYSLYKADIVKVPHSAKLNSLTGSIYAEQINLARTGKIQLSPDQLKIKSDSALFFFGKALEVYPDYIAANNNIGTIYFNSKDDTDKARFHFRRATQLDSNYAQAFFNLATVYEFDQEVHSFSERALRRVESEDSIQSETKKREFISESEVNQLFESTRRVERNLIYSVNNVLSSKSKEQLESKIAELPLTVSQNVKVYFSGKKFYPDHDSLSRILITNLNLYLSNQVSGQPSQVVRLSVLMGAGIPVSRFVVQHAPPKGFASWIEWADEKESKAKDSMLYCLNKALLNNPKMAMAFDKLNNAYQSFEMYDSVIALNKRMQVHGNFQREQLDINIANAFLMKNMNKEGIDYLKLAADADVIIVNKLFTIHSHLSQARNAGSANLIASWITQKRRELMRVYDLIGVKYNEMGDLQNAQVYFNLSSQYK